MQLSSSIPLAALVFVLGATATLNTARADQLVGTSVSGSFAVNAASGAVLAQQFNSPLVIGSGNGQSGAFTVLSGTQSFYLNAIFSNTGLELQITSPVTYSNYTTFSGNLFTLTFSDPAFLGSFSSTPVFSCASDPYGTCAFTGSGLTAFTQSGTSLTLNFGNAAAGQVYDFAYTAASTVAATPEPASLMLAGTAMLGMAGAMRRRMAR